MPKETKLIVFAHLDRAWAPSGQLTLIEEGPELRASTFSYGLKYLDRKDALEIDPVSLSLSPRTTVRGARLLPSDNLPFFGGIRDAAPDSWGRRVIEAKLKVPANSLPESAYLLNAGSDRVGALDVRSSITAPPTAGVSGWHTLQHLAEAAERIDEGQPIPAHLESIFMVGSALGGARPKASIRDEEDVLWLAKFGTKSDGFDIPSIERAVLLLADRCGLKVPPVQIQTMGQRRAMLIRRFDRYWSPPNSLPLLNQNLLSMGSGGGRAEHRLGFVSGLTLVGCDESESRTKAYSDLADAIRRHCHTQTIRQDQEELFKRMILNIFVSNDDDHLRNHGFVWDPRLPGWRLSPLYDVLPRASLATERYLHLSVGPEGRLATLDNAVASCQKFSLSKSAACTAIANIWNVVRQWRVHFDEFGVSESEQNKVQSAFRHLDDVSTSELRKQIP